MAFMAHRARTDDGASAVEYGLLAALIAGVIVFAVITLGTTVKGLFHSTCDSAVTNGQLAGSCN